MARTVEELERLFEAASAQILELRQSQLELIVAFNKLAAEHRKLEAAVVESDVNQALKGPEVVRAVVQPSQVTRERIEELQKELSKHVERERERRHALMGMGVSDLREIGTKPPWEY